MIDSNIVPQIIRKLRTFGPRPIGSKSIIEAANYIKKFFEKIGLEVDLQDFECTYWNFKSLTLKIGGQEIKAIANPFTPDCDIVAEFSAVDTLEKLEKINNNKSSKQIIILYGDLTKEWLFPHNFPFYNIEKHQKIYTLLMKANPLATIFISHSHFQPVPISQDDQFMIPSITVPVESGIQILNHPTQKIELKISAELKKTTCYNVIGRTKSQKDKKVIICAHLDTAFFSPGAHDNASGILVLMRLAQKLFNSDLPISIELIAPSSHEYSGVGDVKYFNQINAELSKLVCFINIDAVGHWIIPDKISFYNFNEKDIENIVQVSSKLLPDCKGEPWYASEHAILAQQNIRCIAFSTGVSSDVHHTPEDDFDLLNPLQIEKISDTIMNILQYLAK